MHTVTITSPPSKSMSHRALMAAALAEGESHLSHVLESDDTARTMEDFTALGATFTRTQEGAYTVHGTDGTIQGGDASSPLSIFVGESGTTCRLITGILAAGCGAFRIHGAGRMHKRPIAELVTVLEQLGSRVEYEEITGCPPLRLFANGFRSDIADAVPVGMDESSQYLSGLLLAAPLGLAGGELRLTPSGKQVVSWPYVSLTLAVLEAFGIDFEVETVAAGGTWQTADWRALAKTGGSPAPGSLRFVMRPGRYTAREFTVEGDWSGASYFLAAGALGQRPVHVSGLNPQSLQADAAILALMESMGARIERNEDGATVFPSELHGMEADMGRCPDLVPTIAALAARARGTTRIANAGHLAIKESDRMAAPAEELRKCGCEVQVHPDGLTITPPTAGLHPPVDGTVFSAHGDHRMAMSLTLLSLSGLNGQGFAVPLDNPGCVAKSFPSFWQLWDSLSV